MQVASQEHSGMAATNVQNHLLGETTCGALLNKLQEIWDEVGESDEERDKMLLQIEEECLDVYKKNVVQAEKARGRLLQALSDAKVELSRLVAALGEEELAGTPGKVPETIKQQLAGIAPALERLWKQKDERVKKFSDVLLQIANISGEISGNQNKESLCVDEADLSLKMLDEYHAKLQQLQKEKGERLHKVNDLVATVHDLCAVLGMEFSAAIDGVHPSLNGSAASRSISNDTLKRLAKTVLYLKEDKQKRLRKLQELAAVLIDLWNLMDTPAEERKLFEHVTCNISTPADQVTSSGSLAMGLIEQAKLEVERLDQLKSSRMKEIALKRQVELEEIYSQAHVELDSEAARKSIMELIDCGSIEPAELLANMENQICHAKEEAFSRKEILDKVEKWMSTCEEESWLEDYNRDENRYNASRGAHLNLKRAEKARILVSKIPVLVDTLVAKTRAWEEDRGMQFIYDGVPLLAMLDEYAMLRQEREEEKRRMREQKKFHEQQNTEQEAIFGSRPSPSPARSASMKRAACPRTNGSGANGTPGRRLSLNVNQNGNKSSCKDGRRESLRPAAPANYVAMSKEDACSHLSDTIATSP